MKINGWHISQDEYFIVYGIWNVFSSNKIQQTLTKVKDLGKFAERNEGYCSELYVVLNLLWKSIIDI